MKCLNGNCRKPHVANKEGAAKGFCSRCYRFQHRNNGQLPDLSDDKAEVMQLHSFRAETDLKRMISKVTDENFSVFVRRVVMQAIQQIPRGK